MKALGSKRKIYEGQETEAEKLFKSAGIDPKKKITYDMLDSDQNEVRKYQKISNIIDLKEWIPAPYSKGRKFTNRKDQSEIYFEMDYETTSFSCYIK